MVLFLLILLCSLYLFVSSSDLTQLFSWITFDASAQSKSISEMPLYYRLFGAFIF